MHTTGTFEVEAGLPPSPGLRNFDPQCIVQIYKVTFKWK
jgi:hypothetical protein